MLLFQKFLYFKSYLYQLEDRMDFSAAVVDDRDRQAHYGNIRHVAASVLCFYKTVLAVARGIM